MICDICLNNPAAHRLPVWLDEDDPPTLRMEYSAICTHCLPRITAGMRSARGLIRMEYARMYRPNDRRSEHD